MASSGAAACAGVYADGWIVFADPDSDRNVDNNETILAANGPVDGLTIESNEFATFMMYRPNGRVMNAALNGSSGAFTLCDDRGADHAKVLTIDLSGRHRASEYHADGSAPSCN